MKLCSICNEQKSIEQFSLKNGKPTNRCKPCNNDYFKKWYENNKKKQVNRVVANRRKNRKVLQKYILEYLSEHPCVDCGLDDVVVLEFDHVRGKNKNISKLLQEGCNLEKLQEEIKLCEVRCANCHRRKTVATSKHYRNLK